MAVRAALAVLLALVPASARAQPAASGARAPSPSVRALALPTRRRDAAELARRAAAVAAELARALGGRAAAATSAVNGGDLRATLRAAQDLLAAGRLDESADSFDLALRAGAGAPDRVSDPGAFVSAHVSRAAIALARGEDRLADELLARLLRYDPTFVLQPGEDSPTMRSALDRVKARVGAAPALARDDLGAACSDAAPGDVLVVARFTGTGAELARYDGCRPVATAIASSARSAASIAEALAGRPLGDSRAGPPPAPAPARARPLYRRPWFWAALGAAVAASAGAAWYFSRDAADQFEVTPRF
jgi:hypothetical protein